MTQRFYKGGFIDLQVNGYGGVSFNSLSLTNRDIASVSQSLLALGTQAYLPTVVTTSQQAYEHVLPLLAQAMLTSDKQSEAQILGIHLEGPFISSEAGAVGAHPKQHIREASISELKHLQDLAGGTIRMITVAPEKSGMESLIRYAASQGIIVSVGHTMADANDIQMAIEAGATLCTHLGNGCPNMVPRHNNPIWAQLGSKLNVMIITDGFHLPEPVIRTIIRARSSNQVIVTSDVAPVAGLPPGEYMCIGTKVRKTPAGRIENLNAPTLAGSSMTMLPCLNHLANLGYEEELLWKLGRDNPLAILNLHDKDLRPLKGVIPVWSNGHFEITQKGNVS